MDMGTGKTLTAIALAGILYQCEKIETVLVVAPLSLLGVWDTEFNKFADFPVSVTVLSGSKEKKLSLLKGRVSCKLNVVVVNYESARVLKKDLLRYHADLVIADEGHKIKDGQTAQAKTLHELGDVAKYKLLLTGTLITNKEIDVWSQYRFVAPEVFNPIRINRKNLFVLFRNRYFYMTGYGHHTPVIKKSMLPEFLQKLHSVAYRVTKEEALDLPETTEETRYVDLEPEAQKLYDTLAEESYAKMASGEITAANILTKILRLSQLTGGHIKDDEGKMSVVSKAKMSALNDIIDSVMADGRKLVIMARFIPEIEAIEELLEAKKITFAEVRGGVKDSLGEVNRFQESPDCRVFIGQIAAAGVGLTLTAAQTMTFFSMDYSMDKFYQAKARIHRIGQRNACHYIYLVARNTIDMNVLKSLRGKIDLAAALVDGYRAGRNPFK